MRKFLVMLMVVAIATFLFVGCNGVTPPIENNPPEIISSAVTSAKVGEAYTYGVEATDPEEDVLTYSLTERPIGMYIVATTGVISWIPTDAGIFGVGVKVSDPDGLFDIQSFNITVVKADEEPEPEPEPELVLVGIAVKPKTMELGVSETKAITSVTATYEVKGYETDIALEDCIFLTSDLDVATVSNDGEVTAIAEGTANILVSYEGKFDTLKVTVVGAITITWFEDSIRYDPDGELLYQEFSDPLGPATLIQDNGGWRFADVAEYYNILLPDVEGSVVIDEIGQLSGDTTYTSLVSFLPIEEHFEGDVKIIVYEDGKSGTMVGTYTQWAYAFGTWEEVEVKYPYAVECVEEEGKWFIGHTNYTTYPR